MLFNSGVFLAYFLPATLAGFFLFGASGQRRLAILWLTLASLFFYGWWNVHYVPLLVGSMAVNFALGQVLAKRRQRWLLALGVAANLALLGYYKYTDFLVVTARQAFGLDWAAPDILLPLAISFFTFQQIAYLSDAHDGVAEEPDFLKYCMFITFFPHLIAGPITHHKEMLPQFGDPRIFRPQPRLLALGATVFLIGLSKKVLLADTAAIWAKPVFAAAGAGQAMTMMEAWGGAVAYAMQIYFDFSGYTDMAIGLGLLFGIRLPQNFDSPYKARNIIEFWSRWHMTLTRFLTAYIYNPIALGLNRARIRRGRPVLRRGRTTPGAFLVLVALPTTVTMFLAGLWHGAGWQFIVFGVLHGIYLTVNHAWRTLKTQRGRKLDSDNPLVHGVSVLATFLCVLVGLVFFRAADVGSALRLLADMLGAHGVFLPMEQDVSATRMALATLFHLRELPAPALNLATGTEFRFLALLFAIVWLLPNTQQWLRDHETALGKVRGPGWLEARFAPLRAVATWRPNLAFAVAVGGVGFVAMMRALSAAPVEFLYFKF